MKRRTFLKSLGASALVPAIPAPWRESGEGGIAGPHSAAVPHPGSLTQEDPPFQRWTWVHGGADRSPEEWQRQFDALAEGGFHGVLVGGGNTELLSSAARSSGLEFHRWIWTLNRNGDAWVRENHPEWFTVSRNLQSSLEHPPYVGYYRWLCPSRVGVRDYLRSSIMNIAQDSLVDGIHLDYVRHCDVILPRGLWSKYDLIQDREYPQFDFCYCETCRELFSSRTGKDPLSLRDPAKDVEWRRFRWDSVTELVKVLADAVHSVSRGKTPNSVGDRPSEAISGSPLRPNGQGKPISAAVFPTPTIARRLVRQAWDEWPLDAFFPMLYHEFYEEGLEWIGSGIREGLAALGQKGGETGNAPPQLMAGLYLPTLNRDKVRARAVEVARASGAQGVSFFEMNSLGL